MGIDTSNYTTSCALYDPDASALTQVKRLLPVAEGQLGLRQSDALFAHVKALPPLMEELLAGFDGGLEAVGFSGSPRDEEGSYMPCFLAGEMAARSVAASHGVPALRLSHQAGHIAAALYATENLERFSAPFLAFHISGGTTQCLLSEPDPARVCRIRTLAETLDLNAGQAVDRVGGMLGLPFPAGPELERLALQSLERFSPKVAFKGADCCLSGLENQCAAMLRQGREGRDVARYCLDYLAQALVTMTVRVREAHPLDFMIYAGGVMSNSIIRAAVESRFSCAFAPPAYSADNAAGTAVLAALLHRRTVREGKE